MVSQAKESNWYWRNLFDSNKDEATRRKDNRCTLVRNNVHTAKETN
jgi:hypothetical protein